MVIANQWVMMVNAHKAQTALHINIAAWANAQTLKRLEIPASTEMNAVDQLPASIIMLIQSLECVLNYCKLTLVLL